MTPTAARHRADMLDLARSWFRAHDVLEVSTPVLSRSAVSDPHIESVSAQLAFDASATLYLRTSPEFCLKRLLASDFPDLYEIGPVFRDGEAGQKHQPEFTMVEWYRRDFGLQQIIEDTAAFIATVLEMDDLAGTMHQISYSKAFRTYAGIDPLTDDTETLIKAANVDDQFCQSLGDAHNDWLDLILTRNVIPQFPPDKLTILFHYPATQAALARICPDDPAVADRFEVFLGDIELANGYVELTDAAEQRRRFADDQVERRRRNLEERPLDSEFMAALDDGLPECAGVAVGFDRLQMIKDRTLNISDVQTFAHTRTVK